MKTIRSTFGLVAAAGLAGAIAIFSNVVPAVAGGPTELGVPSGGYPLQITKPGSYILSANLKLPGGNNTRGISIKASNVTLDFNGFTLSAPASNGKPGVDCTAGTTPSTNVVIKNGIITGFGGDGILLGVGATSSVEHMVITKNLGFGLNFADATSGYSNNIIVGNTGTVNQGADLGGNLCNTSSTCP